MRVVVFNSGCLHTVQALCKGGEEQATERDRCGWSGVLSERSQKRRPAEIRRVAEKGKLYKVVGTKI